MFSDELEMLIDAAIADGEITEKELAVLHKRAQTEGVDLDEFDMILNSRLHKKNKAETGSVSEKTSPKPSEIVSNLKKEINTIISDHERSLKEQGGLKKFGRFLKKAVDPDVLSAEKWAVQIANIILQSEVPHEKNELKEYLVYLTSQRSVSNGKVVENDGVDKKNWGVIRDAYIEKYNEAEDIAKSLFLDDDEFYPIIGQEIYSIHKQQKLGLMEKPEEDEDTESSRFIITFKHADDTQDDEDQNDEE